MSSIARRFLAVAATSAPGPEPEPEPDPVGFVAASDTTYGSGLSLSQTVPAEAEIGDLALAFVMHRDTLTPPSGWVLVASEGASVSTSTGTHSLSVYKRVLESGDSGSSFEWDQSTSQRLGIQILVFEDAATSITTNSRTAGSPPYDVALVTASTDGSMAVVGITWNGAASGDVEPPNGFALTTPVDTPDNRLGVAYRRRDDTQSSSGAFSASLDTEFDSDSHAQISLMLQPQSS